MPAGVPLLLVDGHNLLWRAAFGFPAVIWSRDKTRDLTAEFGFFALLRVAIREHFPTPPEVVVVFDGQHGTTARTNEDTTYKANRVLDDAARRPLRAIPHVQQALEGYGIAWIEIDTAEADDVIATLVATTRDHEPDRRVWILSTDRDFYQLVTDQVHALNTALKRERRDIDPATIQHRYGVAPSQWPDFCALKGDPADNIPGVRGIGPTTAARLLADGLSLDDLPASGRLTGTRQASVTACWEQVLAWRDIIRLRPNLDLPHHPNGAATRALPKPADVIEKLGLW